MPEKTIPTILTEADWNKKKGVIAKMHGKTGIGPAMKDVKTAWVKVNWRKMDPDLAMADTGLKWNPDNHKTLEAGAKGERSKIEAVRNELKQLRDLAKATAVKFKASKTIPSTSRVHVENIAKTADHLFIELKSIDVIWANFEKAEYAKYREKIKATADNLLNAVNATVRRADLFITKVKSDPKPKTFNDGFPKTARDITQQIGNIDRLKSEGFDVGKAQPNDLHRTLSQWGNDGRKVKVDGTREEVLEELRLFEAAVQGVKDWAR